MRPVVIISAPTAAGPDVTGWTIGIVGALGALGIIPCCLWLARAAGVV